MAFKLSHSLHLALVASALSTLFMAAMAADIKYCVESKSDVSRCVLPPFKLTPKRMCKVRMCAPSFIEGEKCGKDPLTRATYVCKVAMKERVVWQCVPGNAESPSERAPLGTCECEMVKKEFMVLMKWEPIEDKECPPSSPATNPRRL